MGISVLETDTNFHFDTLMLLSRETEIKYSYLYNKVLDERTMILIFLLKIIY